MLKRLLLTINMFLRYRAQKRKARILHVLWQEEVAKRIRERGTQQQAIEKAYKEHQKEMENLREAYENQIYLERFRGDSLQRDMTDRFLQLQGLNPMFFSEAGAPNSPITKAKETISEKKQEELEKEIALREAKIQFWADGLEQGKSEDEIQYFWESRQDEIYEDVKLVKYPMNTEQEQ